MALVFPPRDACFVVFSQRADASVDVAAWAQHAARFLATRLERRDTEATAMARAPAAREAWVQLELAATKARGDAPLESGLRVCWSRPRAEDDLVAARSAPGGAGLAGLAERCPQVWLVETDDRAGDDAVALRLAAILAGVLLGPILAPGALAVFGPKTARERLGA
jgi:hypothetical protein